MNNQENAAAKAEKILFELQRLEKGLLTAEELIALSSVAAELHEQLIILKYKALEKLALSATAESITPPLQQNITEKPTISSETIFSQPEVLSTPTEIVVTQENIKSEVPLPENSPSLPTFRLDIPPVSGVRNELKPITDKPKPQEKTGVSSGIQSKIPIPDQPLPFNNPEFSTPLPAKPKPEPQPEPEIKNERQTSIPVPDKPMIKSENQGVSTLNDQFQHDETKTLAAKLGRTKINDLKTAIGLNQKFLFMNDLFEGENTQFNDAVSKLNAFSAREEAVHFMNTELAVKYHWKEEHPSVVAFKELIERRYM